MFQLVLTAGVQGYELAGEADVALLLLREYVELNKRTKAAGLPITSAENCAMSTSHSIRPPFLRSWSSKPRYS